MSSLKLLRLLLWSYRRVEEAEEMEIGLAS